MMASGLGDRRYNDQWTDSSIQGIKRRQDETREFLRRVYAIDRNALSEDDQLNYELFRRSLQDRVDLFKFDSHLIPFYQRGGVQNLDSNTSRLRFGARRRRAQSRDDVAENTNGANSESNCSATRR